MGIFDEIFNDRFDLNNDGNIDAGESFLAYKEYQYVTGDYDGDESDFFGGEDF